MSKRVGVASLGDEVSRSLQDWTQDVQFSVVEAVNEKAQKLVDLLKRSSPKDKGNYSKDWKCKIKTNNFSFYKCIVYNKSHYQLTHLLEDGHLKRNGVDRVSAKVHIKPARDQIEREFEEAVEKAITQSQANGGGYRSAIRGK